MNKQINQADSCFRIVTQQRDSLWLHSFCVLITVCANLKEKKKKAFSLTLTKV